jgi:hypothetical protein
VNKTRLEKEKRKAAGARLLELERPGAGQEETAERESRQHQGRGDPEVDLPWTMSIPEAGARFYAVGVNRAYEMCRLGLMPCISIGGRQKRALPHVIMRQLKGEA